MFHNNTDNGNTVIYPVRKLSKNIFIKINLIYIIIAHSIIISNGFLFRNKFQFRK